MHPFFLYTWNPDLRIHTIGCEPLLSRFGFVRSSLEQYQPIYFALHRLERPTRSWLPIRAGYWPGGNTRTQCISKQSTNVGSIINNMDCVQDVVAALASFKMIPHGLLWSENINGNLFDIFTLFAEKPLHKTNEPDIWSRNGVILSKQ